MLNNAAAESNDTSSADCDTHHHNTYLGLGSNCSYLKLGNADIRFPIEVISAETVIILLVTHSIAAGVSFCLLIIFL